MRHPSVIGLPAVIVLLAGCGSSDAYQPIGGTPSAPAPTTAAVRLDLATGTIAASSTAAVAPETAVHFLRSPGGTGPVHAVDLIGEAGISTTPAADAAVPTAYLASTELTQAQWGELVRRSGAAVPEAPWTGLSGEVGGSVSIAGSKPAFGMTRQQIAAVCTAWNAKGGYHLRLPTAAEWERACLGGATTRYAWGDSVDATVAGTQAQVRETAGGAVGPAVVGSRQANAYGFVDMHGNVWEWTIGADGVPRLRGGSWSDNLLSAAAGNSIELNPALPHALAGVRLVLEAP